MKNEDLIKQAREDFKFSSEGFKENRENYEDDIKFVFKSKQWPEKIKQERESKYRPCLTVNKLKKFVKNVAGDIRQNMPTVKIRPIDSDGDPLIAEIFNDIKRSINNEPEAKMADKIGLECSLAGGFGYYMFITEIEEDGFNQVIKKKRIPNSLSVYLDPGAKDYLYADGRFAFITEKMAIKQFKKAYPKAKLDDWDDTDARSADWKGDDWIIVANYYYREYVDKKIVQMEDGAIYELKEGMTKESLESDLGLMVAKERTVKSSTIKLCKLNGHEVLEEPEDWAGKYIPIIPILGDEESLEGSRIFYSLIRESKDPQRMYNYWRTMAAELIALAPKTPYIGTDEQFEGKELKWAKANIENYSALTYNHVPNVPKPTRERPPDMPAAAINEANIATADIMDSMGKYQASVGQQGNERSGKAILERKKEGDATSFSFVDNLNMATIYEGMILIDLIPYIYDNERVMRLRNDDGQERVWEINKVVRNPQTLETIIINDLSVGKYDVEAEVGPGYATKRAEIADSLLGILQFAPDTAPAIVPRLAKVMDMPDAEAIADDIKAIVQPQPEGGAPPGEGGGSPSQQMSLPMG